MPATAPEAGKSIFSGLKLSGFAPDQSASKTLRFGSADFLAPEAGDVPAEQVEPKHRQKHDMWAVGMLAYLLLTGKTAVADKSDNQVRQIVKKGEYALNIDAIEIVSDQAKDFLKSLLDPVPEMRLTPAIALDHAWILEQAAAAEEGKEVKLPLTEIALRQYRRQMQFRYMTYAYLAQHLLTPAETEKLRKIFSAIDENGDNTLSLDEIKQGYCKNMGKVLTGEELEEIFK